MSTSAFSRKKNVDYVGDVSARQMGMSFATTWASGPSVFLGVFFMWRYGVIPGTAWMVGNTLTLALAGAFWSYVPAARHWVNVTIFTLPLFLMYAMMEGLIMLINLAAIKAVFDGQGLIARISVLRMTDPGTATYISVAIGVTIVALIHRYGFRGSVISDRWQYYVQMSAAMLMALFIFVWSDPEAPRPDLFVPGEPGKIGGREWVLFGFAGIITAAFSYAQMWERLAAVPPTNAIRVGLWGSFFFGLYMTLIWIAAFFLTKNLLVSWLALVIIMTVAASTIDSCVAGMQFIARKFNVSSAWGSITALAVVLGFLFVQGAGIDQIWNLMAAIRWKVVLVAVGITLLVQLVSLLRKQRASA